jgi:hypothetical protein
MKKQSLYATLVPATLICVGISACTLTVSGGDVDGGLAADSATADGVGQSEAGPTPTGDGGSLCTVPDGSDACVLCLAANCCLEETACSPPHEALDDSGTTECQQIQSCYNDCVRPPPDSGIAADTATSCLAACQGGHSSQGGADFQMLRACAATSCSAQCN